MPALTANQTEVLYQDGKADRVVLYAIRRASTGDTFDVVTQFLNVEQAVVMGTTVNGIAAATVSSNTTLTMPAGLTANAAYLLVWGSANG